MGGVKRGNIAAKVSPATHPRLDTWGPSSAVLTYFNQVI